MARSAAGTNQGVLRQLTTAEQHIDGLGFVYFGQRLLKI